MNYLYTNSNSLKDHFRFEIEKHAIDSDIYIASAFFSNYEFIKNALQNNCEIKLIIRLSLGTSISALEQIIGLKNVFIRYYTSKNFHPKLYIFGDQIAFVGSSNLTNSGVISNQEINVGILSDDPRFESLKDVFNEYWNYADVLTKEKLKKYSDSISKIESEIYHLENNASKILKSQFDDVNFPNIDRDVTKITKQNIFISSFLKKYQIFLEKHNTLEEIYVSTNKRKVNEQKLPLRLELDQFLSWIRDNKANSDNYINNPVRNNTELHDFIPKIIDEFISDDFDISGVIENHNKINRNFGNTNTIDSLNIDELYDTLLIIHSFNGRFRYFPDGHPIMKMKFLENNNEVSIKRTIKYLLHGKDNYSEKIANCIYNNDYKLINFGQSNVKELYGWINSENIPICNERTLKSLQWLGFGNLT